MRVCTHAPHTCVQVNQVASVISEIVADDANIIFGTSIDESYGSGSHMHMHTCTHAHVHMHTCTHAHVHMHTHTCTTMVRGKGYWLD